MFFSQTACVDYLQFGNQLTDDELRELSTGRLINRLKLATNRPYGLEECTREMFSLAMLVRLGRITENDVKATFAAFRRLDIGNHGKLDSRTIIEGEIQMKRRQSQNNLMAAQPPIDWEQPRQQYSTENLSSPTPNFQAEYSPTPYMSPGNGSFGNGSFIGHASVGSGNGSFIRHASVSSYYSYSTEGVSCKNHSQPPLQLEDELFCITSSGS